MVVRYSGDAEVRLVYQGGVYRGTVRDPFRRWVGEARPRLAFRSSPTSPEAYDDAAIALLLLADRASGRKLLLQTEGGRVKIRRIFQAPCPIGEWPKVGETKKFNANVARKRKKRHRR